jgi:hypothetical protein
MGTVALFQGRGAGPERGGCMSSTRPVSLDRYQEHVDGMIQAGEVFGVVEDAINTAAIREDQKAALWLLAWSSRDPWVQRHDALAALALVSDR